MWSRDLDGLRKRQVSKFEGFKVSKAGASGSKFPTSNFETEKPSKP